MQTMYIKLTTTHSHKLAIFLKNISRGVNCPSILHNLMITCSAVKLDLVQHHHVSILLRFHNYKKLNLFPAWWSLNHPLIRESYQLA
uniref:Uncharacterized protein n=1 Tax=Populus trichocarpa TaxID=3694 RepID=A0A2K1Z4B7_POPTR